MHIAGSLNKMVFDGERSIDRPPSANVSVTLTFEPITLKISWIRLAIIVSIYVSFSSNSFSGSWAIEFTRFPWPSLCDLDLWSYDLENLYSNAHSHEEHLCQVSLTSAQSGDREIGVWLYVYRCVTGCIAVILLTVFSWCVALHSQKHLPFYLLQLLRK